MQAAERRMARVAPTLLRSRLGYLERWFRRCVGVAEQQEAPARAVHSRLVGHPACCTCNARSDSQNPHGVTDETRVALTLLRSEVAHVVACVRRSVGVAEQQEAPGSRASACAAGAERESLGRTMAFPRDRGRRERGV